MNYCSNCGQKISFGLTPDDKVPRYHCEKCKTIHYQNPTIVVGCLPIWRDKILMCKRAIEPKKGLWTLPAGYMEIGEKIEDGAIRETKEEANAEVSLNRLFSVYSLPTLGQVYCIFLADLLNLNFSPGEESLDVKLFDQSNFPWDEIAFFSIQFTLEKYFANESNDNCQIFLGSMT